MALIRFLLILILVCHWMACTWAMTLKLVEEEQFPQWIDDIAAVDSEYGVVTRDDAFRVYVASFYFCSYTMTSVGYGDIGPKMLVLIGLLSYACLMGPRENHSQPVCAAMSVIGANAPGLLQLRVLCNKALHRPVCKMLSYQLNHLHTLF